MEPISSRAMVYQVPGNIYFKKYRKTAGAMPQLMIIFARAMQSKSIPWGSRARAATRKSLV